MSTLVVVAYPNEYQAEDVRLRLLRAMDVGVLLAPLLPAAFHRTKDLCTLRHLQPAESQGHLVGHTLTVQWAQRVGYTVAMAEDGGSGKVDVLGPMPHDEVCLCRLCLPIAVGDVRRDDVVLRGYLKPLSIMNPRVSPMPLPVKMR